MVPTVKTTYSATSSSSSFSQTTVTKTQISSIGMTFGSVSDAKAAFRRFDVNGDGVMDKDEMKQMMSSAAGKPVSAAEVDALFKKGDLDGDGQIDMHEFLKLMFPSCSASISKLQSSYKSIEDIKSAFRK